MDHDNLKVICSTIFVIVSIIAFVSAFLGKWPWQK